MASTLKGLYGITGAEQGLEAVEAALTAGLCLLQYRNKTDREGVREAQALELLALCRRHGTPLLLNDDVELCARIKADGVHLGQQDLTLTAARNRLGPEAIIGITCHQSLDLARQAKEGGADYVAFGRFFPSSTKPEAPAASPEILAIASRLLSLPIVAIGGINTENGASLIAAGADMLAVSEGLFAARDVAATASKLKRLFTADQSIQNQPQ